MEKEQFFNNLFEPYFHTSQAMDDRMVGIMHRREEYEKRLDDIWENYCRGCLMQVVDYKSQVKYIKEAGLEVLRSKSTGKHKITYKREVRNAGKA